jgi:GT2 family glycosyltransferase
MPRSSSTVPSEAAPDVSVLVVAYRSRGHLPACLAAVPAAAEGLRTETVVVDNASADGTVEWLRAEHPGVHLIENAANLGFAAGVNRAAGVARGEALLLLNPDAVPGPGSVRRLWDALQGGASIAGPQLLHPDGTPQPSAWRAPGAAVVLFDALLLRAGWPDSPYDHLSLPNDAPSVPVPCLSGACLLVRRAVFEELGGLDEGFFLYHEDFDLCLRAAAAGHQVRAVPAARAMHAVGGSAFQDRAAFLHRFHESRRRLLRKHHPGLTGRALAAVHVAGLRLRRGVYALGGRRDEAEHLGRALERLRRGEA